MLRNVLITAGSRRVPLVQGFQRALSQSAHGGVVVVTDVSDMSPAVYAADRAFRVGLSKDPGYIDQILAIAIGEGVGLVVPTIDDELAIFGQARSRFADRGIVVAVSRPDTTSLCDDKFATCRELASRGVAAAMSWLPDDLPVNPQFPLFVKPRHGRGGLGAHRIRNARDLAFFLDYVDGPIIQEYLHGPEFTIDVLCDFAGRPLSIVPRRRDHVRAGVIDRGCTVKDPALIALAEACTTALPFFGAINIQCRVVDGTPVVFEINPRFSGGIPLTIEAGADFPRMLVDLAAGRPVAPAIGQFRDRLWMTNYEASVFLDDGRVHLPDYRPARAVGAVA
ncbi:MAG: ATP-grasp domain-containing protein [Vicinamibacterales bacterium]